MKFISCHIENFGTLSDYTEVFDEGANIILHDNGWGKSTFAAFVRAMFYGLDGERKKSIEENERKRYKPWQGGVFGGRITFEAEGKTYIVTRIFHDKDVNDEFELRDADTNLISNDFSENIGRDLFKIDRESFMRTIFIGQSDCYTSSTDDINAKIGNLTDNTNDINSYEVADKKLTEMLNAMAPRRKTGSISKRKTEIADYESRILDGNSIGESIASLEDKCRAEQKSYDDNKQMLDELSQKQKEAAAMRELVAKKGEWDKLCGRLSSRQEEYDRLKGYFPKDVPDVQSVKDIINDCMKLEGQKEKINEYCLSDNEKNEHERLGKLFADGVLREDALDDMLKKAAGYNELMAECSREQLSADEQARLENLEPLFSDDSKQVQVMIAKWNERNNRKAALSSNKAALSALKASQEAKKAQGSGKMIPLIVGIMLIVVGLIIAVMIKGLPGIVTVILGATVLIAGLMLSKGKEDSGVFSQDVINLEETISKDMEFVAEADKKTADFMRMHGREFDEYSVNMILQEINADAIEYSSLKKKEEISRSSSKSGEAEVIGKELFELIDKYYGNADSKRYLEDLHRLKDDAAKYNLLKEKDSRYIAARKEAEELNDRITAFFEKLGIEQKSDISGQLDEIRDNVEKYSNLSVNMDDISKEMESFKEETDITRFDLLNTSDEQLSLEDINDNIVKLREELESIHKRIVGYNRSIDEYQERYEEWEENKIKLEKLKEEQQLEQTKYNYISLVKDKLAAAKEALTSKYSAPILKSFNYYYGIVTGEEGDVFHLDADTNITVEELGKQREINTLSYGYRDLISVCLRLALADAMYSDELPVLVLDDPFTNLDSDKMKAAKKLLEIVSKKYQVVYFTCSRERAM